MDVRCDRCQTEYELEDESVADGGASVQCTSCGHTFVVSRYGVVRTGATPTPGPSPGPSLGVNPAPWTLTTEEGRTHRFRDSTTLQKWIVERRVSRNDRVAPPGGTWRRLGEMDELRPFFDVVDQADRAAAARGVRTTRPETPGRIRRAAPPYASPDADDDDVFGRDPEPRGPGRGRGAPSGRFDSDLSARVSAIDVDDSLGLDILRPRRPYKKIAAGLVIVGLAAGAGYLGFNGLGPWAGRLGGKDSASASGPPDADPPPSAAVNSPAASPSPAAPKPAADPAATSKVVAAASDEPPGAGERAPVADGKRESKDDGKEPERGGRRPRARESADDGPEAGAGRPRRYEQLVADADRALENGNTAKAQKLFEEALKLQPNGVAAMTGAAYLELDRQRPLAAIGMFKRALASAPSFPQALFGLGEAYRHQGDPAAAVEAYKRYLAVTPSGPESPAARRQIRELEEQLAARREAPATP